MVQTKIFSGSLGALATAAMILLATAAQDNRIAIGAESDRPLSIRSGPNHTALEIAKHQYLQRRLMRRGVSINTPKTFHQGNIVVMEDDGTIVSDPNLFDLQGRSLRFKHKRKAASYKISPSNKGLITNLGDLLSLENDDAVEVQLPFEATFYGRKYSSLFVNSDGSLTFGAGDPEPEARDANYFLNGPPRIAPFFTDLDPSAAGAVWASVQSSKIVVTWDAVPEYTEGLPNVLYNTFQVTLFRNGRIDFVYGNEINTMRAIVGITPGGGLLGEMIDLSEELPVKNAVGPVLEDFILTMNIDVVAGANLFYETEGDHYQQLVVFLDFHMPGFFIFQGNVKNEIEGIGLGEFDVTAFVGSAGTLESVVFMGETQIYRDDPNRDSLASYSTYEFLGLLSSSRWLSYVQFMDSDNNPSDELLGPFQANWSFFLDSDASVHGGNDWADNRDGSFTSFQSTERFSDLDLYLMGFLAPDGVDDIFFVDNASNNTSGTTPQENVRILGDRVDVTIDDIIAVEGPRLPDHIDSPKVLRQAFVILGRQGEGVRQETIDKVERIRAAWEVWYANATRNLGSVDTRLR